MDASLHPVITKRNNFTRVKNEQVLSKGKRDYGVMNFV